MLNKLEVPLKRSDNNCMLDKEDKYLMIADVEDKMSKLYWEYRNDLNDEGGKRLEEELDYLKTQVINILEKYPA